MNDSCPEQFIQLAVRLADAAREIVRGYYRSGILVEDKADQSPVTAADRAVESSLRAIIASEQPAHGVMGEEQAAHQPDAEYVWVLDPIDGTKAFVSGIPVFGTLIALTRDSVPILGVIDQAVTGERWLGARGHPTTLNGRPARTRACLDVRHAILCATAPEMFLGADHDAFTRVSAKAKFTRYGTDCYAYGLLSSGLVDLVVEASVAPHDYMAHVPVVQGAGGVITDWAGGPLDLRCAADRVVAAGDSQAHSQVLCLLKRAA